LFVDEVKRMGKINVEEMRHLKDVMEKDAGTDRVPKDEGLIIDNLKKEFKQLKIENNRDSQIEKSSDINKTHYGENPTEQPRSRYQNWQRFKNRPDFDKFRRSNSQKGMWRTSSGTYHCAPSGSVSCPPPG
jgi:hypothetical protein